MAKLEPNLEMKRYPLGTGCGIGRVTVTPDGVSIAVVGRNPDDRPVPDGHDYMCDPEEVLVLDPSLAPIFRMVALRLDDLAGKLKRRG